MIINFMCQFDWPQGALIKYYFWVGVRVFLDEISI